MQHYTRLNFIQYLWDKLRDKCFHNLEFELLHALENHLEQPLNAMEYNRATAKSIVCWPYTTDSNFQLKIASPVPERTIVREAIHR